MSKLGDSQEDRVSVCRLCHGKLDNPLSSSSALRAIEFTEKLSLGAYGTPTRPNLGYIACEVARSDIEAGSALCHCCKILKKDIPSDTDFRNAALNRIMSDDYARLREKEMLEKMGDILLVDE